MSAAADARGLKRVCVSCGIRFYDFNKRPIECPNCDTEYTGEIKVKGRRGGKIAADAEKEKLLQDKKAAAAKPKVETEEIEQEEGVVSLADLEEAEDLDDEALENIEDIEELEDEDDEELEVEVEKE